MTCTITIGENSSKCTTTLSWPYFTFSNPASPNIIAKSLSGSVTISFHIADPAPVHLDTKVTVSEVCAGTQSLQSGGDQTIETTY